MLELLVITMLTQDGFVDYAAKLSKTQTECRKLEQKLVEEAPESIIRRINPYTGEVDLLYIKISQMFKKPCRRA